MLQYKGSQPWLIVVLTFTHPFPPLADEDLPQVPPLTIVLPHNYPTLSPICDLTHYKQSASPFVKLVGTLLTDTLAKQPMYSFSTVLNSWELCVLRAMSKILNSKDE